ncbi:DUF1295 domain-containing protein [Gordonia sp. VNQ95]|jgi:steroid 5-alpha reductase family enzyme|uniref:DUF1295 domain-containing protein n=1 Tax=Gordonia TaxID=2053 RepID=UPI0032B41671
MSAIWVVAIIAAAVCVCCWVASLITGDTSWVDRIWSVVPVVYLWVFCGAAGFDDPRLLVMAILVTLWGARLTFNFARRGGYSGMEDYRWQILRSKMSGPQFGLFNLFFIVIYQNLLLVLITLPANTALHHQGGFGVLDVVLAMLFLAFLAGETVADQQQWAFHARKAADVAAGREPASRFVRTGLFRYCRHPNYFCEQAQWWVIYAFGASAAGSVLQPSIVGAVLLTVLFIGSTRFTESITVSKYPEYADYQRSTSGYFPLPPRRHTQVA